MVKRFGDSPAYFGAGKGSRRRQETKESRQRYRENYDKIFGKREIKNNDRQGIPQAPEDGI